MPPSSLIEELRARRNLISLNEVADILGFHLQVVHRWVRKGDIPHFRIGGRIKFEGRQVAEWMEKRQVG